MPRYALNNQLAGTPQNLSSSYKSIVIMTAQTTGLRRGKLDELVVGADGTPADNAIVWDISRQTAAGTATSATPTLKDPGDPAAATVGAVNATAEGTITASSSLLAVAINQRASYRWVASPGGELVWPATNAAGLAARAKSPAYTSTVTAAAGFQE